MPLAWNEAPHEEFYYLSQKLIVNEGLLLNYLSGIAVTAEKTSLRKLCADIESFLS